MEDHLEGDLFSLSRTVLLGGRTVEKVVGVGVRRGI